jgi:ribonuclease HI
MPSARSWATPRILANLMHPHNPHFLLYSESAIDGESRPTWKFVLQAVGDDEHFAAADTEPGARSSRLELLAVVRGLEALDQPSRVTLLTRSRYVRRGIRRELNHWRERRWRWERFGKLVPIQDHDLWQRVDRALEFHQVECCAWSHDDERANGRSARGCSSSHRGSRCTRDAVGTLAAAIGRVRQTVVSSIAAIWRTPFTRAA